jgi:uncharacterized protein (TIGR00251 family)
MAISTRSGDGIIFSVRVVPRASKSHIVGVHENALKVRIASPPVDGAANDELVKVLAKFCGVSRSAVEIVSGESSKSKRVRIAGISPDTFEEKLK